MLGENLWDTGAQERMMEGITGRKQTPGATERILWNKRDRQSIGTTKPSGVQWKQGFIPPFWCGSGPAHFGKWTHVTRADGFENDEWFPCGTRHNRTISIAA